MKQTYLTKFFAGLVMSLFFLTAFSAPQPFYVDVEITNKSGTVIVLSGNSEYTANTLNGTAVVQAGECDFTSIETLSSEVQIKAYPNPARDGFVYLELDETQTVGTQVLFYNVQGRQLGQLNFDNNSQITLSQSNGLILYQVLQNGQKVDFGSVVSFTNQLTVIGKTGAATLKSSQAATATQEIEIFFEESGDRTRHYLGTYDVDCQQENQFSFTVVDPQTTIKLPIEVMGADLHVETVEFELGSNWEEASYMWFEVHNVQESNKMQFRINGNAWYSVSNSTFKVSFDNPGGRYGGFGGGFSTLSFAYNVTDSDFKEGTNLLEFRFQMQDDPAMGIPISSGYRVMKFNVRPSKTGVSMVSLNHFEEEDPTTWQPPMTAQADIDQGGWLWMNASLKDGSGSLISAKCADCHAVDGRDLKYFNFSNKSIITRAQFHGLTKGQGQRIASYIRSLPNVPYVDKGRPWNPPYQPGPGTDSKTAYEWAAGSGLEAVLKSDGDMVEQMFGTASPSRQQIDAITNTQANLNLREIGVAIQFPDWLHWLPKTHPKDLWGEAYWNNSGANNGYVNLTNRFINQNAANSFNLINWTEDFHEAVRDFIYKGNDFKEYFWVNKSGTNLDVAINQGYSAEFVKYNLTLWQSVKLYEIMNKYGGQDQAKNIRSAAEYWQWPSNYFSVFQAAAHFTGDDRGTSAFQWQTSRAGVYFSSAWYELQMVLSPGMRSGYDVEPVDWAYNMQHVNLIANGSSSLEPMRLYRNIIKCWQQRDRPGIIRVNTWSMREVSPWRLFCDYRGDQRNMNKFNDYQDGLRGVFLSSMVSAWKDKVDRTYPSTGDWWRTTDYTFGAINWFKIEPTYYNPVGKKNPVYDFIGEPFITLNGSFDAIEAIALYRCLTDERFDDTGLDTGARADLEAWCELHFAVNF